MSLVADRGAVYDRDFIAEGMPRPAPDTTKVFATSTPTGFTGGLIAGLAGKGTSPNVDLPELLQVILDASPTARRAAAEVADVFDSELGEELRQHAGLAATPSSVFGVPVVSVVLIGGRNRSGYTLTAVGLRAAGGAKVADLDASVVFALTSVQADAELMMLRQHTTGSVDQATREWMTNINALAPIAAREQRVAITPECNYATLTSDGSSGVQ